MRPALRQILLGRQPFDFYVDSVNGSDSNNGKTPHQAFKNLTALPALKDGQRVGLACGSHWRQQLTSSGANNITIAGYGNCTQATSGVSSTLPIIDGSDVLPNANFVKTAGYTNVYNTASAITFFVASSSNCCPWVNVHEDNGIGAPGGLFLANVSSIALVDSTPGTYYIPGMTGSVVPTSATIYIHPYDSSSPITNGYTYDFTNRAAAMFINGHRVTVKNVEVRGGASVNGTLALLGDSQQDIVDNVICRHAVQVGLGISGGSMITNSLVINMYNLTSPYLMCQMMSPYDQTGSGLDFTISGNIIQQDQNLPGNVVIPFNKQIDNSGTDGAFTFSNNWIIAKNGATVVASNLNTKVASAKLSNNNVSGANGFFTHNLAAGASVVVSGNNLVIAGAAGGYAGTGAPSNPITMATSGATISLLNNNICHDNCYYGTVFFEVSGNLISSGNKYFLRTATAGYGGVFVSQANTGTIQSSNDDFGTSISTGNLLPVAIAFVTGWTFNGSNNIYENKNLTPNWKLNSSTAITSLAAWQATAGVTDTGSTESGGNAASAATLPPMPLVA